MCCFGTRIFLLIFITVFSFGLNRLYPEIPVVFYYFILANFLAFLMMFLFFTARLPSFVKPNAIHYFSLIGGFLGSLFAMVVFKKFAKDSFTVVQILLFVIWIVALTLLVLNFSFVSEFFRELVYATHR
ncbi:L-arabinose ABC transporter [Campylobacter sp. 9BO]|uniref:L-arabinose ABC transporter n=1 Tax=Campylobacter sp. 9BO TaxID=3424759 RepID=UPI003D34B7A5